ncbi:MAG: tetraacyldisaccharide 4'-kinase [Pirellulales bacterium]|nr:tetraacyldisaccharide 4'-kinase [Pirellulales bacterium]
MAWDPSKFRELVSGRRRGATAALLRAGLRAAEVPYRIAVGWRNRRYDRGKIEIHRAGVPVVSVGNLSLGGTGKTPMVQWIARWFRGQGVRVAVISRGYGAEDGAANDEALELEQKLPDVPHLENPDRAAAARVAVEELDMQAIVLDDAFQHRRIARDLDVVLLDALEPFGFDHVFPRGTLREPVSGLARADVVALSRADLVAPAEREAIRRRVLEHAPRALWMEVVHHPAALWAADGRQQPIDALRDQPVAAFCGLGNPTGFRRTLDACGYRTIAFRTFPDHHRYDRGDVESLADWAKALDVRAILCTHKDLVKLGIDRLGPHPLWALSIELEFLTGQAEFEEQLRRLLSLGPAM